MNLARFTEIHLDPRSVLGHPTVDVGHRQLEAVWAKACHDVERELLVVDFDLAVLVERIDEAALTAPLQLPQADVIVRCGCLVAVD